MPQQPGRQPERRPEPRGPSPREGHERGGDDGRRDPDNERGRRGFFGGGPREERCATNRYLDPYHVPSAAQCNLMMPFGQEFGDLFPRFHPSWLQRIHTPIPRMSAFPLHGRDRGMPQGGARGAGGRR